MRCFFPLVLVFALLIVRAQAAPVGARDMALEAQIEAQLAALDPEMVAPFREARLAADSGDYVTAESRLRPVVARFPQFDPALRRLGSAVVRNGRREEGLKLIREALSLNRSAANLTTLAAALAFSGKERPTDGALEEALGLMRESITLPNGQQDDMLLMTAQLALMRDNRMVAHQAVKLLREKFPDLMQTHYFGAYLAAADEKWILAEDEMRAAEELGLDHDTAQKFYDAGIHSHARNWRMIRGAGWAVATWILGLVTLFLLGYGLSRITLRHIERADPRLPIGPGERRLRHFYRAVLNAAGLYYYISLPVVALLVVLLSGTVVYAFLSMGRIPIQLTLMLIVGVFATLWSMGKSLFLRVQTTDPGRALTRGEAEGLWQLSERVARDLNTRPIDEIRITPGTDLCVYERGSWREKMDNRAKRVLVVGAAVLNDFKISAFRSVLAHEYGHFSNRDTAGGDIALRVRNDMIKFYYTMVAAGQATWLNVAFHFLRAYDFIFRRISHGATRLQEVLADRVAALRYGPAAFESGLRHVIRQSAGFDFVANREIKEALDRAQPVANLYSLPPADHPGVEQRYAEGINRPTNDDDTHPGPLDRFRLISTLPEPGGMETDGQVWDLFQDRAAIAAEMMKLIEANVATQRTTYRASYNEGLSRGD